MNLDRALRRQVIFAAVDMRLEGDAGLVELPQLRQRHDLKAAGIRQNRVRPVHEFLQATQFGDALRARPQHQVIGIAEDDIRSQLTHCSGYIVLTVACVPTGMKAGVRIWPWAVVTSQGGL